MVEQNKLNEIKFHVERLLESFEEPCRYDHHGFCQTHFLHEMPCPIEKLKECIKK
jgi:hypothetical protein